MIKAVITSLCLTLLLATSLPAQTSSSGNPAVDEAVRRQAARIQLRQKLTDARSAEQRRDLVNAAKLYDEAWALVQTIGSGVDAEARQTVAGLTAVRMELAKNAQKRGDLRDADLQVKDVLRINPKDEAAIAFHRENQKQLDAMKTKMPSVETLETAPAIQKEKVTAAVHTQNAKFFYESGKYEEAKVELKKALAINPNDEGALYYAKLVQEAQFKQISNHRVLDSGRKIVQVEEAWNDPIKRDFLPVPNPMARTNLINTSSGRQAIMSKLDRIHLDTVFFDSLPLSEVIRSLNDEVKKRDPLKRGINFIINPNPETVSMTPVPGGAGVGGGAFSPPPVAAPTIDPATGLPVASTASVAEAVDINAVSIKLNPALTDVRLADVLEAVITVADHPIKYSITDFAIVFSLKGPESPQLHMRKFKVDPNTFIQGLENVSGLDFSSYAESTGNGSSGGGGGSSRSGGGNRGGGGQGNTDGGGAMVIPRVVVSGGTINGQNNGGNNQGQGAGAGTLSTGLGGSGLNAVTRLSLMSAIQTAVIQYFAAVGVDLSPTSGKNVFFNDREGSLLVRATSQELDIIEAAIQTLNVAPPQVNIKTKFVEVTQNDSKALGFDWILGNVVMGGKMGLQGGTAPSYTGAPSTANPEGTFPGSVLGGTATPVAASDGSLTSGLRNTLNAPAVATFTGILTDPQFRVVLHALEQRDGADLLNQGEVTTLSGRQAQIQVVDLKYIVTGSSVDSNTGGTGTATGSVGTTVNSPLSQQIVPTATAIPLGPTLDVIPYVSADGYTLQMTLIPTIVEFVGYDDPGPFLIQAQAVGTGGASVPLTSVLPLPHFRIRQITSSVVVWDGQTIVLGGLISDNVTRVKDKVPVLGDLPLFGRFFRNESSQTQKKNLVIFVTPTIIDPAGNRLHTDEELPFTQTTIPSQQASMNP